MFTKNDLESMEGYLKTIDENRKYFENEAIRSLLRFFNLPDKKSDNLHSIEDFLEYDNIVIFMPEDNYRGIDFSKLSIPKKLMFQVNRHSDKWSIIGFNNYMEPRLEVSFKVDHSEKDLKSCGLI